MTGWVILVDQPKDLPNAETPHKVITTSEYLARPRLFDMGRPKLVNLARSYAYQSKGYYASLLAEARGHRVVPTVETMLELREAKLYEHSLPELEDELNRCARRADYQPEGEFKLLVCFGIARDERFEQFGRLCSTGSAARRSRSMSSPAPGSRSSASGRATSLALPTGRRASCARRSTATPSANGATPRRAPSRSTTSPSSTIPTRRWRRPRRPRSSTWRASPRSSRSTSSR
jgi:hypothetical protein